MRPKNEQNIIYSDLSFKPQLNNEGDLSKAYDYDAIEQSLTNILNTRKGARPMNPEFGCNVHDYLFEIFDRQTAKDMLNEILNAFKRYEQRIQIVDYRANMFIDTQAYVISIDYKIKGANEVKTYEVRLEKL